MHFISDKFYVDIALDFSFAVSGLNQLVQYSRANIQSEYFFAFFGRESDRSHGNNARVLGISIVFFNYLSCLFLWANRSQIET